MVSVAAVGPAVVCIALVAMMAAALVAAVVPLARARGGLPRRRPVVAPRLQRPAAPHLALRPRAPRAVVARVLAGWRPAPSPLPVPRRAAAPLAPVPALALPGRRGAPPACMQFSASQKNSPLDLHFHRFLDALIPRDAGLGPKDWPEVRQQHLNKILLPALMRV